MSEKQRQRSPWRLSLFVFLGVFGFYLFLARPAEPVEDLKISGDLAYMVLGRAGLLIVDAANQNQLEKIGSFDTTGHASGVAVFDQLAYIADGRAGLRIIDVSNPSAPQEISAFDSGGYADDVAVKNNFVYLADGKPGLQIIDISENTSPILVSSLAVKGNVRRVVVQDNIAYLGDNQNQLRVVDVTNKFQPQEIAILEIGAQIEDMDVSETTIYLATGTNGLVIVDISKPEAPTVLATIETPGNLQDVAVNLDTIAYLADGENGVSVYDISDLNALEQLGYYDDFLNANQVEVNEGVVFVSDRDSALHVVDVELDLTLQRISSSEQQQGNAQAIDVNYRYAFVANANQGLQVLDLRDPAFPVEVAAYDSPGAANGVLVSGDFVFLADGEAGVQVLSIGTTGTDSLQLSEFAKIDSPGEASQLTADGQIIYLADGSAGLQIISTATPSQPAIVGSEDTPGNASGIALLGDYAYIADGNSGLRIINILDSTKPAEVGAIAIEGNARAVAVQQVSDPAPSIYAFIAAAEGGLHVIDVTNPQEPYEVGVYTGYETVLDVKISGAHAYLATGSWGFRVLDISNPANLSELGVYNTPGETIALDYFGDQVFIADNTRGMRIISVANHSQPEETGFYDIPRIVRNVTVEGDYAYLTDLDPGFRIADISNPRHLAQVGHYDQGGIVEDIGVQDSIAYLADSIGLQAVNVRQVNNPLQLGELAAAGRANAVFIPASELIYFTDSVFGMYIADASDPANIAQVSSHVTPGSALDIFVVDNYAYIADGEAGFMAVNIADPVNPIRTSIIDQFQNANSVVVSGDYAFVADAANGLWVIDITKPVTPETVAYVDTPGTALDLEISGFYLFVADGEAGVQVINILNPSDPVLVSNIPLDGNSLNLDTEWRSGSSGNPGNFFIYVAKGDRGLEILSADKSVAAVTAGLFETPGMAPIKQVVEDNFPIIGGPGQDKSARTVRHFFFDIIILGFCGLLIWLAFFAQFVLPLNTLAERSAAFNRLFRYLTGTHGQAIRIENGRLIQGLSDRKRSGPGVVLLDTASAAMLRTKTAFKRAVGPGVVFTDGDEFVHQEALDLHTQVRPIPPLGPLPTDDPFAPRNKRSEDQEQFEARQARRKETSALTRDGVEVVPNILAIVKTKNLPGQGGTRFGFNAQSVQMAITREGIVPDELNNVVWSDIPALLAVDLWREYLGKFTLTELFITTNSQDEGNPPAETSSTGYSSTSEETSLEIILRMVYLRLTQADVPLLDDYGQETGEIVQSREFKILEEMGIQVKDISISALRLPRIVESQLVQQWLSSWLDRAVLERDAVESKRGLAVESGREAALIDFATAVTRNLSESILDDDGELLTYDDQQRPDLAVSLEMLVSGTQQLVTRSTRLHHWLTNEESEILRILEWIRR